MRNEKSYFNKSGKVLNTQLFSVYMQSFLQLLKLRKKVGRLSTDIHWQLEGKYPLCSVCFPWPLPLNECP